MIIRQHKFIFILILSVCAIVPLTNDIFISGIPAMKKIFPGDDISLVLSISLLGLAVVQLFYGPLLDRFGRRPVLLTGLLLFTLASAEVMLTNSFSVLLISRFFQAVGACSASTSTLAIVRDTFKNKELVKATSLITVIMGVGPAIAPLIGSFLNHFWGWRASFEFLFILGSFYIFWIWIFFKETLLEKNMEALAPKKIFGNYLTLIKQPDFLRYCTISGFSFGVLFSYIGLAPYFIIEQMYFDLISFGVLIAVNTLSIIVMAIIVPKMTKIYSFKLITQLGLSVIFCAGLLMWLLNDFVAQNIYTFMLPTFLATLGIGIIRPTASAGAMQLVQSKIAGSAASFFNSFTFISGTISIVTTTRLVHHTSDFSIFIAIMGGAPLLILNTHFLCRQFFRHFLSKPEGAKNSEINQN